MISSDVWMWVAAAGFGLSGLALASMAAKAEVAPEPKLGRFRRERERFRARGGLSARAADSVRALTAVFWLALSKTKRLDRYLNWQEQQLRLAGFPMGLTPHEMPVVSFALAGVFGLGVSFAFSSFSAVASASLVGLVFPLLRVQARRSERVRAAAREVPRTMDLLGLCMSAGMDLVGGLKEVSSGDRGVVAEELRHLLATLEMGQTRRAALREFYENLPALEVGDFARAIIQAEAKGASVRDALTHQATMSRQRRSVRAEELASRASVLLTLPMMMLVVCVLILVVGPMIADPSQF